MLRSRADATDVVQALFVDLIQRGVESVDLPYLYRAVGNRCLNFVRDEKNRARLLAQDPGALAPPARTRTDEEVIGVQLLCRLAERLPAAQLEVLVCRYFDDMTQDEIAEHLGVSRKSVGKWLAKIREEVQAL
jgi:RNA polymerase sigma-70 factor (ECF subfamily)